MEESSEIYKAIHSDSSTVLISEHAYERAKERLSLNRKAFLKLAQTAYREGIKHSDTKGSLRKYINKVWFQYKSADNTRIYGEHIFLFNKNFLITVYQLPNELKKHVKCCK